MQEKAYSIEGAATSLKTKTSPFYLNTLEFVLCATVAVALLHIHYVDYSEMCNCAPCKVQTQLKYENIGARIWLSKWVHLFGLMRIVRINFQNIRWLLKEQLMMRQILGEAMQQSVRYNSKQGSNIFLVYTHIAN